MDVLVPALFAEGATLPTWMGNVTFTELTTTAESLASVVVPVIVSIMGIVVGINLLKRFVRKI